MTHEYYRTVSVEVKPEINGKYFVILTSGKAHTAWFINGWRGGQFFDHWLQPCTLSDLLRENYEKGWKDGYDDCESNMRSEIKKYQ